jgi:hypothetical protein
VKQWAREAPRKRFACSPPCAHVVAIAIVCFARGSVPKLTTFFALTDLVELTAASSALIEFLFFSFVLAGFGSCFFA